MSQAQYSGYPALSYRDFPPRLGYSNAFDTNSSLSSASFSEIHPYNTTPSSVFPDTSPRSAFIDYFSLNITDNKHVQHVHPFNTLPSDSPISHNPRKGSSSSTASLSYLSTDGSTDSYDSYHSPPPPASLENHMQLFYPEEEQHFLSARQTVVLQEAHQEAQRRASSDSASPPLHNSTCADDSARASLTFSPILDNTQLQVSAQRAVHIIRPIPTRPAPHAALLLSQELESETRTDHGVKQDHIYTSLPSLGTFINSNQQRSKQLGSIPADEAFATSLDQLSSCGSEKPPFLWWTLIRAAILGAPQQRLPMDLLCSTIAAKFPYFSNKNSPNWKSSIRSVIHTKPCFQKTEDSQGTVWWSVHVDIDPREQRRGLKKRSNSEGKGSIVYPSPARQFNRKNARIEEEVIAEDTEDEGDETDDAVPANYTRKRRKTG